MIVVQEFTLLEFESHLQMVEFNSFYKQFN